MRRFVPTAFLLCVPTQVLLWSLGSVANPHPGWFAALLISGLVGAFLALAIAILGGLEIGRPMRVLCAGVGVSAIFLCVAFVLLVLTNDDAEVAIVNGGTKSGRDRDRLRLLDLNVLHGFPDFEEQERRFQRTVDEFAGIDADVIILQEAWNTTTHGSMAERLARRLGMNFTYARANGSRPLLGFEEGSAILSRYPLVRARRVRLQPHEPFWENRIALLADIDVAGEVVTVAGVHLSTSIPDAQAKDLLTKLPESGLLLVAGDFNAFATRPAVVAFEQAGFQRLAPTESHVVYGLRDEENRSVTPIDHVILSPAARKKWTVEKSVQVLTSFEIGPRNLRVPISDHDAIVVDLRRR